MSNISRRDFLKGSAATAIGLAALGGMNLVAHADEEKEQIAWDGEYDVVVLGHGFAGMCAAVQAADTGASVLLSEKAPKGSHGVVSRSSGQYIMSTDDKESFYTYLHELVSAFPNFDDDMIHTMVEGAYGNFDWLVNTLGADPKKILQEEPWETASYVTPVKVTAFDNREGYIQKWCEYPELPGGDHSLSILVNGTPFDSSYFQLLNENVEKREAIEEWFEAPGKHLIKDETGRVIGVKIAKDGKLLNIKAKGGVVLATGGFENNPIMMANYMQRNNNVPQVAIYNEGDGIKMGLEAGADLWHMSNAAGFNFGFQFPDSPTCAYLSASTKAFKYGIIVGSNGTRFMNEPGSSRHGRINIGGSWIMAPIPNPSFLILDDAFVSSNKIISRFSENNVDEIESGVLVKADTLEELAEKLGIDVEGFVNTVNRYNDAFDKEEQADCNRPFSSMLSDIRKAPFYGLKLVATCINTQGGPRRNKFAQVVDVNSNPIPGLFSAGELGAMWPDMYNGGGNIGECTVYGRIAGENAAKAAKGEFEGAPIVDIDAEEARAAAEAYAVKQAAAEEEAGGDETAYVDGVYTGTGVGYGGDVTLEVTIEGGKITDIQVEHGETEGIGAAAIPQLVEQAIAGKTEWTDAISGASLTTKAFQAALEDALAQAK